MAGAGRAEAEQRRIVARVEIVLTNGEVVIELVNAESLADALRTAGVDVE